MIADSSQPREKKIATSVRLPIQMYADVKAKLKREGLTYTDLVWTACTIYLASADKPKSKRLTKRKGS